MVISEFIKDVVHYKDMLSLSFTELNTSRPVDFAFSALGMQYLSFPVLSISSSIHLVR